MTNGSGRPFAKFAQCGKLCVHFAEPGTNIQEQPFSGLRRRHASRRPVQKPEADPFFQVSNDLAEGRLSHSELRGSPRENCAPSRPRGSNQVAGVFSVH